MVASIKVSRELHAPLKALKEGMRAKSFEEVLRRLLEEIRPSPRARFGAHPEMRPFSHRDGASEP
jgi:predicted CopG family antitoxin